MDKNMIPLVKDTINNEDIDRLIEWLKTYPRLTKGNLTVEYEKQWSNYLGCNYSVFVNSGSSANLLMLYALIESGKLKPGDKIVVPTVSWSTDLSPVLQLGLEPILCDCNLTDLSVDLDHLQEIIVKDKPKLLLLVSVLGLVPEMNNIVDICEKNGIILLEDACESLGSEFQNKKLGTFGLMSSFSTYFGHHMSTIEGGMICTDNKDMFNIIKSLRSHGWDRDLDKDYRNNLRKKHDVINDFESLYKFYYLGFNFRSTDLQAFIGMGQLGRLQDIVERRNQNYNIYQNLIKNEFWKAPNSNDQKYISNFAYPIISLNRQSITAELINNQIETRPLICGSLGLQPFWVKRFGKQSFKNADIVDNHGFYLPNNHQLTEKEINTIAQVIGENL
jgi:CDP-6-deoxy-D-xylo-4-hexulose-3-dehydrase